MQFSMAKIEKIFFFSEDTFMNFRTTKYIFWWTKRCEKKLCLFALKEEAQLSYKG